jgi:hypothetical protein
MLASNMRKQDYSSVMGVTGITEAYVGIQCVPESRVEETEPLKHQVRSHDQMKVLRKKLAAKVLKSHSVVAGISVEHPSVA